MAANLIGSALQRYSYEETIRLNEVRNRIILSAMPDLLYDWISMALFWITVQIQITLSICTVK